jgi:hypothetical protein
MDQFVGCFCGYVGCEYFGHPTAEIWLQNQSLI